MLDQSLLVGLGHMARWGIRYTPVDSTHRPNILQHIYADALVAIKPDAVTIIRSGSKGSDDNQDHTCVSRLLLRQSIVQVQDAIDRDKITEKITDTLFERSAWRYTFLLFRDKHAITQWYAKTTQIEQLFDEAASGFSQPEALELIDVIDTFQGNTQ